MDILSFLPHAGAAILIVLFVQALKKIAVVSALFAQWYIALPFALGVAFGIPISFANGQPQWYWLILNPIMEGMGAVALYHVGKKLLPQLFPQDD